MKKKMKRKELLEDEFSDFSLSSPATKIRRLDAELPPIMEEDEPEFPLVFENAMEKRRTPILEELPCVPQNDERAMVVFKPINTPLCRSPSNFSLSVDPNIISGFKSQGIWSSQLNPVEVGEKEEEESGTRRNNCLAVVPWVAHPWGVMVHTSISQPEVAELMEEPGEEEEEAAAAEAVSMEIEDNNKKEDAIESEGGGVNQWQQQHCMIAQMMPMTHNTSTPIVWYR